MLGALPRGLGHRNSAGRPRRSRTGADDSTVVAIRDMNAPASTSHDGEVRRESYSNACHRLEGWIRPPGHRLDALPPIRASCRRPIGAPAGRGARPSNFSGEHRSCDQGHPAGPFTMSSSANVLPHEEPRMARRRRSTPRCATLAAGADVVQSTTLPAGRAEKRAASLKAINAHSRITGRRRYLHASATPTSSIHAQRYPFWSSCGRSASRSR